MARYEIEAEQLRRRIHAREWEVGETLPPLADLASKRGVSRETMRNALGELEREGLVRVVRGTGAIVQPPSPTRRLVKRGQVVTRSSRVGYVFPAATGPNERWMAHGKPVASFVSAPQSVAEVFGLPGGTEVLRRRRVTSPVGNPPFQIADTWISPQGVADAPRVADPSTGPGGYLDRLEEAGHGPISWTETTRVRMPTPEEARLLEISKSVPVLEVTMLGTSARTHGPIEMTVKVIPGDRVELVADLRREGDAQWPVTPIADGER